jgi:hypothetical protein
MITTVRHLCRPRLAFVAIVAALWMTTDASACSTMSQDRPACLTICGCCSPETGAGRATRAAGPMATSPAPLGCATSPGGGCPCCVQEPAAPAPGPDRSTTEGRAEPGAGGDFGPFGADGAARIRLVSRVSMIQGPPKTPLYLRIERLLF